jgi:hypothetical protein
MPTPSRTALPSANVSVPCSVNIRFPRSDGLHGTLPRGQRMWVPLPNDDKRSVAFRRRLTKELTAELGYTDASKSVLSVVELSTYGGFILL